MTTSTAPGESKGYIIDMNDGSNLIFNERPFTPMDVPAGTEVDEFDFDATVSYSPFSIDNIISFW